MTVEFANRSDRRIVTGHDDSGQAVFRSIDELVT